MSSLTIEQLKKELTAHGVTLPASSSKKIEYVKLYEQFILMNNSSLDNLPGEDGDKSVSSSDSPSKNNIIIDSSIRNMSDDELYNNLNYCGVKCGPVVPSTRNVYERKLAKLLNSGVVLDKMRYTPKELDSERSFDDSVRDPRIDAVLEHRNSAKRSMTPDSRESYKSEVLDSSTFITKESTFLNDFKVPSLNNQGQESSVTKGTRVSYIETIPKGSSKRYIQPISQDFGGGLLRSRFLSDEPLTNGDDYPRGRWSPNISHYSTLVSPIQTQKIKAPDSKISKHFRNNVIAVIGALLILLVIGYIYHQWASTDPYKLLADDVEKEIQQFTEKETQD